MDQRPSQMPNSCYDSFQRMDNASILNYVVKDSAASIILVHNHPSGDPTPSRDDMEITRRLKEVGELLGVKVLDHIIIGGARYTGFADEGIL